MKLFSYQDFLKESKEEGFPKDLCYIVFKTMADEKISFQVYASVFSRDYIKREWGGKRIPHGFPGPDKYCLIGRFIEPIIGAKKGDVYVDDATIVFPGPWSKSRDFNCKVVDRKIVSTWKDLADFIGKQDPIFKKWMSSDKNFQDFMKDNRGLISGQKFGI